MVAGEYAAPNVLCFIAESLARGAKTSQMPMMCDAVRLALEYLAERGDPDALRLAKSARSFADDVSRPTRMSRPARMSIRHRRSR